MGATTAVPVPDPPAEGAPPVVPSLSSHPFHPPILTCVNVVRCLRLAGVGQDAVVGVWPACWLSDDNPLPGEVMPAETVDRPLLGSGLSFLKAPSAVGIRKCGCMSNGHTHTRCHSKYECTHISFLLNMRVAFKSSGQAPAKCCIIARTARTSWASWDSWDSWDSEDSTALRPQDVAIVAKKKVARWQGEKFRLGALQRHVVGRMNMQYGIIYANFWHINRGSPGYPLWLAVLQDEPGRARTRQDAPGPTRQSPLARTKKVAGGGWGRPNKQGPKVKVGHFRLSGRLIDALSSLTKCKLCRKWRIRLS